MLAVTNRIGELKRTGAWPLVCYAIGTGRLRLDLELAGARNLAGLARAVEAWDREAVAAARAAGLRLGWKTSWTETVPGGCPAVLLAWHVGQIADLTSGIVDAFDTELAACMMIPPSSRRAPSPPPAAPPAPRPRPPASATNTAASTAASAACSPTWPP